jgi:hypothetical protein
MEEPILYLDFDENDMEEGMSALSFVDKPATEIKWEMFQLQEELQKFTGHDKKYSTGDTVAVHMLALSILLGCKKIYITGVDLDYKKGYFGSYRQPTLVTEFDPFLDNILKDFHIINESAKRLGVEIINLSQSSHLSKVLKTETL